MPRSNIEFLEICSLNRGVLIERLLQVSYGGKNKTGIYFGNTLGAVLFSFLDINIEA